MPLTRNARALKYLLHLIFFLSGIATVLIGQVLPIFSTQFRLNDLEVSFFFPAQFLGSLIGTFLSSRFGRRDNYMTAVVLGCGALAGGVLMMNGNSFAVCLIGFLINGMGVGLTLPSINMLILELAAERSGAALSLLNFCWGVGAIVCKPFVDIFRTADSIGWTTWILAAPLVAAGALLLLTMSRKRKTTPVPGETTIETEVEPQPIWRMPISWAIAFFNFIHVGFESGMGGWLTTYTDRLAGGPYVNWLSPTLLYFLLFVTGRGVAPLLFRYLNENKMLFLGLAVVFTGIVVTISAGTVLVLSVGAAISGFGTSWIFPTNISRFSNTFGPSATRRATPLFVCGTLGAAAVTWLIGYLSNRTGDLRSGMYVLVISIVLLILLQTVLALKKKDPHRPSVIQIEQTESCAAPDELFISLKITFSAR